MSKIKRFYRRHRLAIRAYRSIIKGAKSPLVATPTKDSK